MNIYRSIGELSSDGTLLTSVSAQLVGRGSCGVPERAVDTASCPAADTAVRKTVLRSSVLRRILACLDEASSFLRRANSAKGMTTPKIMLQTSSAVAQIFGGRVNFIQSDVLKYGEGYGNQPYNPNGAENGGSDAEPSEPL